jgi:Flp pilus assembly protein TadG
MKPAPRTTAALRRRPDADAGKGINGGPRILSGRPGIGAELACAAQHRGTAIVEFTVALPFLLFLMLATAEFGRILSEYNTLTKSVRDATRYLASNAAQGTTGIVSITSQVQTQTTNLVVTGNINGSGSALLAGLSASNVTVSDAGSGYVSVSVTYTYVPMIGATLPTFGFTSPISLSIPLKAAVIMRSL